MATRAVPAHYPVIRERPIVHPVIEFTSWLDGAMLGEPLNVLEDWTITDREDDEVRGELKFAVPRTWDTDPTGWSDPLGNNGQTIRARVGVRSGLRRQPVVWVDLGHYRIMEAEPGEDTIDVLAKGPGQSVKDARFTVDPLPLAVSTYRERALWLLQTIIPATVDPRLVNRAIPVGEVEGRERLKAFLDVLETWPAVAEPDGPGLRIRPPYDVDGRTPELTYSDGEGGTLVSHAPVTGEQESRPPNAMVVSNDAGTLQAVAAVDLGPYRYGGPYGHIPAFYASPMFTTVAQCHETAIARLARAQHRVNRVAATVVTDLRVTVGSIVRLRSAGHDTDAVVRVTEVTHKRDLTEMVGAIVSGTIRGTSAQPYGLSTTTGTTPVADLGAGRITIPVGDTGTWSDKRQAWRTDTADLVTGRNEADSSAGFAWWGRTPQGLPGTLVAGSLELIRTGQIPENAQATLTPQLIAGTGRVGTGKPVVVSTAAETISLGKDPVTWEIPPGWLPHLDSGAAGGFAFLAIDQDPVTIASSGRSLTLRLDWRR